MAEANSLIDPAVAYTTLPIQDWRRTDPWSVTYHKVAELEDSLRYFDKHFGILVDTIIQCIQQLIGRDHVAPFVQGALRAADNNLNAFFSVLDRGLEEIKAKLQEQKNHVNLIITEVIDHSLKEACFALAVEQRQPVLDQLSGAAEHLKEADIGNFCNFLNDWLCSNPLLFQAAGKFALLF